mmetsp:Transcript_2004/g.6554  ORF Transcript_2004/g.6554 Transcript_2004/m.6554 type:complete len:327 (+) Transcript_2004:206-1186(+)
MNAALRRSRFFDSTSSRARFKSATESRARSVFFSMSKITARSSAARSAAASSASTIASHRRRSSSRRTSSLIMSPCRTCSNPSTSYVPLSPSSLSSSRFRALAAKSTSYPSPLSPSPISTSPRASLSYNADLRSNACRTPRTDVSIVTVASRAARSRTPGFASPSPSSSLPRRARRTSRPLTPTSDDDAIVPARRPPALACAAARARSRSTCACSASNDFALTCSMTRALDGHRDDCTRHPRLDGSPNDASRAVFAFAFAFAFAVTAALGTIFVIVDAVASPRAGLARAMDARTGRNPFVCTFSDTADIVRDGVQSLRSKARRACV